MKPGNDKKIHLINRYLERPSLRGTFARARKAWRDAIMNNRWWVPENGLKFPAFFNP